MKTNVKMISTKCSPAPPLPRGDKYYIFPEIKHKAVDQEGGRGDYFQTNIGNFPFFKSLLKRLKICKNCYKNKFVKLELCNPSLYNPVKLRISSQNFILKFNQFTFSSLPLHIQNRKELDTTPADRHQQTIQYTAVGLTVSD